MKFGWPALPMRWRRIMPTFGTAARSSPISRSTLSYRGPAVESRRRYYWQVRTWDAQGQASSYSQPSWWEMGLLSAQDWKAKWITRDMPLERGDYESAPKWIWAADDNALTNATPGKHDFRFRFELKGKPKSRHALHHCQRQCGGLGERQAGADRIADGQFRTCA